MSPKAKEAVPAVPLITAIVESVDADVLLWNKAVYPAERLIGVPLVSTCKAVSPENPEAPPGKIVPIPTLPWESTIKLVAVLDPTANAASPASELTERRAKGVELAKPVLAVKLFVPEKVLESASNVEDAELPELERHVPDIA